VRRLTSFLGRTALYVALVVLTVVIGAELARPFQSASITFDSQSSVLFFDRIGIGTPILGSPSGFISAPLRSGGRPGDPLLPSPPVPGAQPAPADLIRLH